MPCTVCLTNKPVTIRCKDSNKVCKECFFNGFEKDIHDLIVSINMFSRGTKVGIGVSGGKDSTVLAYVLDKLNKEYNYGIELFLICIDEGINGYRDQSIKTVIENQKTLNIKLKILSYKELFGLSMDDVVKKIGRKGNCTYCGTFRRHALEEAARNMGVDCIVTGHNADDMAETVLLNFARGDISRLRRCTFSKTKEHVKTIRMEESCENNANETNYLALPRCKPFKYTYQKEIVLYAYYKKLLYFSTECTYAPGASRGDVRTLIKSLERENSAIIINIIKSMEWYGLFEGTEGVVFACKKCSHSTSSKDKICTACNMIEKLNKI